MHNGHGQWCNFFDPPHHSFYIIIERLQWSLLCITIDMRSPLHNTQDQSWNELNTNSHTKNGLKSLLDRSLMIGWRKNSWNAERVSSVFTLNVCVSVCTRATEHIFWPRNLIFGSSDPWDTFFVFRNFHFYAFYWHFYM